MDDHANSFGSAADIYERGRPGYPAAALDWLLAGRSAPSAHDLGEPDMPAEAHAREPAGLAGAQSGEPGVPTGAPLGVSAGPAGAHLGEPTAPPLPRVVDLGAGTGKLTRQIHALGLPVTAVDPSPGMLGEFRRAVPGVPALRGSAENLPLPDRCADVVLVAQAWHWVDRTRAVPEIARVLSPGGRLGLIWNLRDDRVAWVRRLGEIIGNVEAAPDTTVGPPFAAVESARFTWSVTLGPERLLDLVASRSAVILMSAHERAAVLAEVRRLAATHPDLVGRTEFELPYVTHCARATLPHAS